MKFLSKFDQIRMFPFYTLWEHQKTFGFLVFSGGIKWELGCKMGLVTFTEEILNWKLHFLYSVPGEACSIRVECLGNREISDLISIGWGVRLESQPRYETLRLILDELGWPLENEPKLEQKEKTWKDPDKRGFMSQLL